jgi:hypothetical protein
MPLSMHRNRFTTLNAGTNVVLAKAGSAAESSTGSGMRRALRPTSSRASMKGPQTGVTGQPLQVGAAITKAAGVSRTGKGTL